MGNWRTVTIVGTCPADQVEALRYACRYPRDHSDEDWSVFHCLTECDSLAGLGHWVGETMNASGNLAERDYTINDVVNQLRALQQAAPGLRLKVHCGDDWESKECIATITVDENGVRLGVAEIDIIRGASRDEMQGRLLKSLLGRGW